jgi:hypothetical protein
MRSPLGSLTDRPALTRSCSPPPGSWSRNSTAVPGSTVLITPCRIGGVFGRRELRQCRRCHHHPQQRPPTAPHRHGLGQNGDSWMITHVGKHADLTVRHTRSRLTVRMPVEYVRTSTAPIWQSDPDLSPTSPTRSKITPAKVAAPRQPGLQPELTRAPLSFVKSQRRAANGINRQDPRPTGEGGHGNSDSTGISPIPPIRRTTRGLTNGRQHTPHRVAPATRGRTKHHPVSLRAGQPHPAANLTEPGSAVGLSANTALGARSEWLPVL